MDCWEIDLSASKTRRRLLTDSEGREWQGDSIRENIRYFGHRLHR
jgi:hypothetical protein